MRIKKIIMPILLCVILLSTTSYTGLTFSTSYAVENQKIEAQNETNQNAESQVSPNQSNELNLYCEACILVECSTYKTAYEKNSNQKMYPASTTKLLTALISTERCKLDDSVTITNDMVSGIPSGYTIAYLRPGENYTVEQLLNLLLIPSANDAGYALAIHISGSIDEFATLMNQTASKLGCTSSNFTNPSGIHDDNHYSTAKDLSIIGLKATENETIREICQKKSYEINGVKFETTNTLMTEDKPNYYEYANGLKTGFTAPAGSCIIATAEKDGMKFLAVVLKSPEPTNEIIYRDVDCKTLFEYGFEHYDKIVTFLDKILITFNLINSGHKILEVFLTTLVVFLGALFCAIVLKRVISKRKNEKENNSLFKLSSITF